MLALPRGEDDLTGELHEDTTLDGPWIRRQLLQLKELRQNGVTLKLPTFLLIGANKCGTTTVYHHLRGHSNVFMADEKEPHFFVGKGPDPQIRTLADYTRLFDPATPDQYAIGEASSGYLHGEVAPRRVRALIPDARLIAILRDPAERAWAAWLFRRRLGLERRHDPFDALTPTSQYVCAGQYGTALRRWLALFPREQLRVSLIEDLAKDATSLMGEVFTFIGVDPLPVDEELRANAAPRDVDPMPAELRRRLVNHYREDTSFVEGLLDRDLSDWRRPTLIRQ
jgi:hypothetical protein